MPKSQRWALYLLPALSILSWIIDSDYHTPLEYLNALIGLVLILLVWLNNRRRAGNQVTPGTASSS